MYLSAAHILGREFSGMRLAESAAGHSQEMTNMWPYLWHRQEEAALAERTYQTSFLASVYRGLRPISPKMLRSADHAKQAEVCLR